MNKIIKNFTPKKILLCQLRQIGDVIISTAIVEILSEAYPQAKIDFYTEKNCAPMLYHNPKINKIWELDKKSLPTLAHEVKFYWHLARNNYDLVIDFQQLPRCRWVVAFSQAKYRLTTESRWYNRWLYTHSTVPQDAYAGDFKSQILKPLGLSWNNNKAKIYLSQKERDEGAKLLGIRNTENKKIISVDIPHRHKTRCWPAEYYAQTLDLMAEKYPKLSFFLPYGPGEKNNIEEVVGQIKHKDRLIIPDKVIDLRLLAASISHASLHIGNCSAPRHMATALDIPSFTILGSTSTGWTYPSPEHKDMALGLDCQPCNKNSCPINIKCLIELKPQMIIEKLCQHYDAYGL